MTAVSFLRSVLRPLPLGAWIGRGLASLLEHDSRIREARQLRRLDDRILRDIGITRAAAEAEARRLGHAGRPPRTR